ncbi:MAG TPA: hypothetical protein VFN76_11980, partial [Candidatus Limnocylindria bacterium]|nr:hypothetical protein [Candidatus Limnocylindria bacterium]
TPPAFLIGAIFSLLTVLGVALALRRAASQGPLGVTMLDSDDANEPARARPRHRTRRALPEDGPPATSSSPS